MVLIVNTTEDKGITSRLRQYALDKGIEADIVEASDMKISHCIGCNHCWLDTPGECSVKDDYEVIIRKLLKADQMWVISNTALGFIDHKGKNVYDRILPILTMNLKFIKGQMRHICRYDNRVDMGLILLSEDVSNPVLIVCGGGPGIPQYLLEELYPSVLPSKFTVCYWDYRGVCTSYDPALDPSTMDTDRFVEDTVAVTDYLRDRFGCDKVYIMGHSFGTYVALQTVSRYPEKYCCYIAMSQVVDQRRSEIEAYDYMRQRYVELGDENMVSRFDEYDIRNSHEDLILYCSSGLRDEAMHELGVGTARDMDNVIEDLFFPSLRVTSYTQGERIDLWRGKALSKHFAEDTEVKAFNAMEDIPSIEVPIVFVVGRYDMTCCADLQQEYYEYIEAPYKKLYVFEESAHSPLYEESERAAEVLDEIKEDITCI